MHLDPKMNLNPSMASLALLPDDPRELFNSVEKELRTPMATLIAASDMLASQLDPQHPARGYARLIRSESDRLRDTLNDLALLALPLEFTARPMLIAPVISSLAGGFRLAAEHAGVRWAVEVPSNLSACADPDALRVALGRVARFCLESMSHGGSLLIRGKSDHDMTILSVSDSGPSVPVTLLNQAFNPYVTLAERRPGMALALLRRVVEHLGGGVAVWNNPEGGITIEARLRAA